MVQRKLTQEDSEIKTFWWEQTVTNSPKPFKDRPSVKNSKENVILMIGGENEMKLSDISG